MCPCVFAVHLVVSVWNAVLRRSLSVFRRLQSSSLERDSVCPQLTPKRCWTTWVHLVIVYLLNSSLSISILTPRFMHSPSDCVSERIVFWLYICRICSSVHLDRYFDHDISRTSWTFLIQLPGNIH